MTGAQDRAIERLRKKYVSVEVAEEDALGGDLRIMLRYTRHEPEPKLMILTPSGILQEPVE